MARTLRIYEMKTTYDSKLDKQSIQLVQVLHDITEHHFIDKLISVAQDHWHLEGDCGFEGEIYGDELIQAIKDHGFEMTYEDFEELESLDQEDLYRLSVDAN